MPTGSRQSLRASLTQVWKTTGRKPAQLADAPECPEELEYLWDFYREVFTGEPLTFQEMEAWSRMTGKPVTGWEADALKSIDRAYWRAQSHDKHRSTSNQSLVARRR